MTRRLLSRAGFDGLGLAVFALIVFPIYWMVATAFKPGKQILSLTPVWVPWPPTLENFQEAIARPFFLQDVQNSVMVVVATVGISITVAFLAAVAVARYHFRGKAAFVALVMGVQLVPLNALVIPLYLLLDGAGLTDTLAGVVLSYLAFVLPFMVWTLTGFVANIPPDLEEAAMIDGCSRLGTLWRILLPLAAPGLVATAIYGFVQAWNEYIVAYILLSSPRNQTLTVWLASFTTNHGTDWGGLMAGATITSAPVVVFFLLVQRHFAAGLTAGAVKG